MSLFIIFSSRSFNLNCSLQSKQRPYSMTTASSKINESVLFALEVGYVHIKKLVKNDFNLVVMPDKLRFDFSITACMRYF